ncbi:hypothetical protein ABZN20_18955 [Methylococcus sp. ANG]|uniref:hypothetical protein n=1 Tax=Methylococcus sp. ANG TaxID=3231903 RepID=UPI003457BC5A
MPLSFRHGSMGLEAVVAMPESLTPRRPPVPLDVLTAPCRGTAAPTTRLWERLCRDALR